MNFVINAILRIRAILWAVLVAYMLGWHNFYKGDDATSQSIGKIEIHEEQGDSAPKDRVPRP